MIEEKIKTIKKLTPPREGLDSLLHRTTTSFLFLIPKDCENLSKTSFLHTKSLFYQVARACRALAADGHAGPLQNTCFTMFQHLDHRKRSVFRSLGRDGCDGQACRTIGPSWSSKITQKCPKMLSFGVTFCKFL